MNDQKKNIVAGPPDQQIKMVGREPSSSRFCNTPSGGKKKVVMITLILLFSGVLVGSGVYFFFVANKDVCANIIPNGTEALVGDGFCNGGNFMTNACGNDGGDCDIGSCSAIPASNDADMSTLAIVLAADVNNDGFVDLIIGHSFGVNQLLLNTGDATTPSFQTPINLPGGEMYTSVIIAADVNNDGFLDLIIGNRNQANQLLLNTGDATGDETTTPFQTPINLPGGEMSTLAIVAADVNNDGFVDLIIGGSWNQANQLILNTGDANGDGTTTPFQTPINLPGGEMSTLAIVASDVNNDGFVDLIIGNAVEANQLLLNTGDANGDGTTTRFQAPINLPGGEMYTDAIVVADVNNDGFLDLIIGNFYNQANQLLLNTGDANGDGTTTPFQTPTTNLPGGDMWTSAIIAADVNNDGFVDLIIGNFVDANQLLLNSGEDAIFGSAIDIPCSSVTATRALAVADMDNDGYLDIVFGNEKQKNQLLMNLGDGISYKEPAGLGSSWLPEW
jgi:hypothetical protein